MAQIFVPKANRIYVPAFILLVICSSLLPAAAQENEVVNTGSVVPQLDPAAGYQGQPFITPASGESILTGKDILEKIDSNVVARNRRATTTMIVHGRRGKRTMRARVWVQGTENSFSEYLAPPREKGTKMLKLKEQLWIYSPSTDRIIRIAGHMLRRSMMGSDVSYEDTMEDPRLVNIYEAVLEGEEEFEERPCYVLKLTATEEDVAYHSRKLWVDKERFLPLREDRFARSGKLLKTFWIKEVFQLEERWYPKRMVFKDVLKQGKGTEYIIDEIELDIDIPDHVFSKASLRR